MSTLSPSSNRTNLQNQEKTQRSDGDGNSHGLGFSGQQWIAIRPLSYQTGLSYKPRNDDVTKLVVICGLSWQIRTWRLLYCWTESDSRRRRQRSRSAHWTLTTTNRSHSRSPLNRFRCDTNKSSTSSTFHCSCWFSPFDEAYALRFLDWQMTSFAFDQAGGRKEQRSHHNDRRHILCSICDHSFGAWRKLYDWLFIASLHNQPMFHKMCSIDIFVNLQPVCWNLKGAIFDPRFVS